MKEQNGSVILKKFFKEPERFADLMNATLYDDMEFINHKELKRIETDASYDCLKKVYCQEIVMEDERCVYRMQFECGNIRHDLIHSVMVNDMLRYIEQYVQHGYEADKPNFQINKSEKLSFQLKPVINLVVCCCENENILALNPKVDYDILPKFLQPLYAMWKVNLTNLAHASGRKLKTDARDLVYCLKDAREYNDDVNNALNDFARPRYIKVVIRKFDENNNLMTLGEETALLSRIVD